MNTRLQALGQQLGFVVVLGALTEIVWHQPNVHPLISALGYLIYGVLFFDLIHVNQAFHPMRGLIIAGLFGMLQASLISGNLVSDFPLSVALYGAGISTAAFLLTYILFFQPLRLGLMGIALAGLFAGLWVYGTPGSELIDVGWQAPEFIPTLILAVIVVGLGLGLNIFGRQNNYTPMPLSLTLPALGVIGLASIGLAIMQLTQDNLTAVGLLIVVSVVIVLVLMLWFIYLNKLYTRAPLTESLTWLQIGLLLGSLAGAYAIGYVVIEALPDLGDVVVLALIAFGSSWLPFLSAALGFEAFVQLADEGIL